MAKQEEKTKAEVLTPVEPEIDRAKVLEEENAELREANEALLNQQADMDARLDRMEAFLEQNEEYAGPEPELHFDPFDRDENPLTIKKHPDGLKLDWKNPKLRNSIGWQGWKAVTYDSEIGKNLSEYINDPPARMEGISDQDNYVRRGTDSILCTLDEEVWLARHAKRESKALRKQFAANVRRNTVIQEGVETYGDGVQIEGASPGGFKARKGYEPLVSKHPHKRTEMFTEE